MRKIALSLAIAGLGLMMAAVPARAQKAILLGGGPSVDFTSSGDGTIRLVLRTCDLLSCTFASGSASENISANTSSGTYSITTPAAFRTVLALKQSSAGSNTFVVTQFGPLNFSYSSSTGGSFTGNITLSTITQTQAATSTAAGAGTAVGTMAVTGGSGSLASSFGSSTANVSLNLAIGGNLSALVTQSGRISAEVDRGLITPPSAPPPPCDFLTGGGWIPNTNSSGPLAPPPGSGNGKANFAIGGGCKLCQPWGHLNYIDHGNGLHVQGDPGPTCPVAYSRTAGTTDGVTANGQLTGCRHIHGDAQVNGSSGFTYDVDACDNGEPGTSDTFSLTVTSGSVVVYRNSDTLGGGTQGGGNIQLHKGNQSFCCSTTP